MTGDNIYNLRLHCGSIFQWIKRPMSSDIDQTKKTDIDHACELDTCISLLVYKVDIICHRSTKPHIDHSIKNIVISYNNYCFSKVMGVKKVVYRQIKRVK